ncbi:MAG TPA: hypothetical protein PKD61_26710 [Polyangiaceae bacterium]|nr:hypothetical protein [Polyangiaceae bacterium]
MPNVFGLSATARGTVSSWSSLAGIQCIQVDNITRPEGDRAVVALEVGDPHAQSLEPPSSSIEDHQPVRRLRKAPLLDGELLWRPRSQSSNNRPLAQINIAQLNIDVGLGPA